MKLEDVKIGMWVRTRNGAGRVVSVDGGIIELAGGDRVAGPWGRSMLEPWKPRVGEWIRASDHTEHRVADWLPFAGFAGCALVNEGGRPRHIPLDQCEPCAPPEAKPVFKYIPPARSQEAVASGERIAAMAEAEMTERLRHREMLYEMNQRAIATRAHNAACPKCGGRAYQGLLNAECVEPVCDDPRTRMPDAVTRARTTRNENVWIAIGRERVGRHPTEEGAIAAWREAVSRKP